jgi:ligand-binding sensor domain-containing protein
VAVEAGSLWVGHRTLPEVWRVDPATGRVQARIATGSGGPVAVAAGDGQVWAVATSTPGSVLERIDPASDAVVASRPLPVVVDTLAVRNGRVWLASRSGGVVLVLSDDGRRLARVEVPGGPSALALDRDGAWVTGGSDGTLTRIALPSFAASSAIRPGGRLTGVVDCAGRLWVATGEGNLDRVDPRSGAVRPIAAGRFLSAVASDGKVVWAVDGAGGDATAVDCSTGRVVGAVAAGQEATAVVAAAGSAWIVDSGKGVVVEVTT